MFIAGPKAYEMNYVRMILENSVKRDKQKKKEKKRKQNKRSTYESNQTLIDINR